MFKLWGGGVNEGSIGALMREGGKGERGQLKKTKSDIRTTKTTVGALNIQISFHLNILKCY